MNLLTELRALGWLKAIGSILLAIAFGFMCWAGLVLAWAATTPIPQ